jgi:hypothetical protein
MNIEVECLDFLLYMWEISDWNISWDIDPTDWGFAAVYMGDFRLKYQLGYRPYWLRLCCCIYGRYQAEISAGISTILTEAFHGLSQSLNVNARMTKKNWIPVVFFALFTFIICRFVFWRRNNLRNWKGIWIIQEYIPTDLSYTRQSFWSWRSAVKELLYFSRRILVVLQASYDLSKQRRVY